MSVSQSVRQPINQGVVPLISQLAEKCPLTGQPKIYSKAKISIRFVFSQVSQGSSKMVSWGTISFDDDNSDSGRGTEVSEKEIKPSLDEGEKVNIKVAVGIRG